MKELEIEPKISDKPLIEKWVKDCIPVARKREQLLADETSIKVPEFIRPIVRLWGERGPVILTSYSHPENFNFYKIFGRLNLELFLERMREKGFPMPIEKIIENLYETVPLDASVTSPLKFGGLFQIGIDLLGLGAKRYGTDKLRDAEVQDRIERISLNSCSQGIVDRLRGELDSEIGKLKLSKGQRAEKMDEVKNTIKTRLLILFNVAGMALGEFALKGTRVNQLLFEVEERFVALVTSKTEIKGQLSTDNKDFADLVLQTIEMLISELGIDVLKKMVDELGDGLFIGSLNGESLQISVDKDTNTFVVLNKNTYEKVQELEDNEILDFVKSNNFFPLAKAEVLALVAGATTFHMGSERGNRQKALQALGIDQNSYPEFYKYVMGLRIGQDLEQGNKLFVMNGQKQPISCALAFVLFGRDFLRGKIAEIVGATNQPISLSAREFKLLCAKELLVNPQVIENIPSYMPPIVHAGGALWD